MKVEPLAHGEEIESDLQAIVSLIKPLPSTVRPANGFLEQTRLSLLKLPAQRGDSAGPEKRQAA